MALITCPDCGKQISSHAIECNNCGCPQAFYNIDEVHITEENITEERNTSENLKEYVLLIDNDEIQREFISFINEYVKLMFSENYISQKSCEELLERYKPIYTDINKLKSKPEYMSQLSIPEDRIIFFCDKFENLLFEIEIHNEAFSRKKMDLHKIYMDEMLKSIDPDISLDEEQRKVVLSEADNALIVAGAGAGKTTTMAAKVKYLVEKENVDPNEIIVISYTKKAVKELQDKINKQLGLPDVRIMTFHAFGNEIIRKTTSFTPEIAVYTHQYFIDILKQDIYENKTLLKNLILFFGYYMDIPEEALKFETLDQYHAYRSANYYETLKSTLGEYNMQIMDNYKKKQRTIRGEFLRSVQEVQIANYLYLHGIDYEYEKVYEHDILEAKKKYTPDFYIKQGTKAVYLEHFGIHEDGTSTLFDANALGIYKENVHKKILLHAHYGTKLLYTFSKYKDGKSLLEHLEALLLQQGFVLYEKDDEQVYRQLMKLENDKYIFRFAIFMQTFIGRFKTNGYKEKDFVKIKSKTSNVRNQLFLDIALEVYKKYRAKLTLENKIDFEDMINQAEEALKEAGTSNIRLNYKYVIIDEYQDIAKQRFNLARRLVDVCRAKIVAVGDDWQSIFAFSGADINLFIEFDKFMGKGDRLQITHTYRNSQELIDIAGSFVQENPSQIQKALQSPKSIEDPVVIKVYDDSYDIMKHKVKALVEVVAEIVFELGENAEILFIGRYGFDIHQLCKTGEFEEKEKGNRVLCKQYPKTRIVYMTAHSSKGLGFDNVVILNGSEGKFGFPSQIEDDPIMKLVLVQDNSMLFAEERRLFYVALTRTKNRVYILTPSGKPSRFVLELTEQYRVRLDGGINRQAPLRNNFMILCPECGFPLKKEYNKNYGLTLYHCTNEPEICDFMTNSSEYLGDIHKCSCCKEGYMIVKKNSKTNKFFFGCTNFNDVVKCRHTEICS